MDLKSVCEKGTKYRARRRQTSLKLEAAQQNLLRVNDIVHEVGKQLESMKRQASKARRYVVVRDELTGVERILFGLRFLRLDTRGAELATRLDEEKSRERAASVAVDTEEAQLEAHQRITIEKSKALVHAAVKDSELAILKKSLSSIARKLEICNSAKERFETMAIYHQATERLDLKQFVSALDELQQIWRATDLGRVKSVATIPSISTHQQQGEEGRKLAHIPGNLIRLCVGGEHPDDVIADLDQALHKMRARVTLSVAEEISGPPRAEPEAPSPVGS